MSDFLIFSDIKVSDEIQFNLPTIKLSSSFT
jgi:hypothetical protein